MTIPKRFSAYLEKAEEVYLSFEALMKKTGDTVTYENGKRYKLSLPYPIVLPFVYRTSPMVARALGIDRTSFQALCRARRTLLPIDRPMSEFKRGISRRGRRLKGSANTIRFTFFLAITA